MKTLYDGDRDYALQMSGRSEPRYCFNYRVMGRGNFPFDMLRYDMAHPCTSDDAANLYTPEGESRRALRIVKLCTWAHSPMWRPTYGRWDSFGWPVVTLAGEEFLKGEKA